MGGYLYTLKYNKYAFSHFLFFFFFDSHLTLLVARSRFNRGGECNILLSKLASEGHPHIHALYEWINPITDEGS